METVFCVDAFDRRDAAIDEHAHMRPLIGVLKADEFHDAIQ
jgi:hypothetical protein